MRSLADLYMNGRDGLPKDPAKAGVLRDVLYTLAETCRIAAAALSPILPEKGPEALRQLGSAPVADLRLSLVWGGLVPGTTTAKGDVLFPRIETKPS